MSAIRTLSDWARVTSFESPFPGWIAFATCAGWEPDRTGPHPAELAALPATTIAARRLTFTLGRVAARRALEALGRAATPVLRGSDGAPRWPAGVVGTITHTADRAAAAVAWAGRTAGLGLDLEDVRRFTSDRIEPLVVDEAERRWIAGDAGRLASVFSAKEAIFKAFFPRHGAFFGFDAVHLDASDGGFVATLRIALADWPTGSRCEVQSRRQGPFVLSSVYLASSDTLRRRAKEEK